MRPVVFTGDVFRLQARGGISRYFAELMSRLRRPWRLVAGLHASDVLGAAGLDGPSGRIHPNRRAPGFPGSRRVAAVANAAIDAWCLGAERAAILHPTYYRDPARLPRARAVVATVFDMAHERHPERFRRPWWSTSDPARHKAALCRRADVIVCISDATRRDLLELLPVPPGKTRVVHLGAPSWSGVAPAPIAGVPSPFFLWVGERRGYKNFAATLQAWAGSTAAAETALLCLGGGPLSAEERVLAAACGATARLHQVDAGDAELRWAYERASGLLYTSLWEGFGLPVLEAMSLGCPVVASDRPAIREVAGDRALLVEPTRSAALRDGIDRCLAAGRDEVRAEALRAQARGFTWEACAEAHESIYRELDR